MVEEKVCPICRAKAMARLVEKWKEYRIYECPLCVGQFAWPMKAANYQERYKGRRFEDIKLRCSYEEAFGLSQRPYYFKGIVKILKRIDVRRALDVGCGPGVFAKLLESMGIEVFVLDVAEEPIRYAKEVLGLKNTFVGTMKERPSEWKDFDLITAFEVLKHVESPREFISGIYRTLKAGGYFILTVPNNDSLFVKLGARMEAGYPPHHLTRWRKRTLEILLKGAGFVEVRVKALPMHRRSLVWFFPFLLKYRHRIVPKGRGAGKPLRSLGKRILLGPVWRAGQIAGDVICFVIGPFLVRWGSHLMGLAKKP